MQRKFLKKNLEDFKRGAREVLIRFYYVFVLGLGRVKKE